MIDFHPHGFTLPRHTIDGVEQDFYETATLQDNLDHSGGITVSWKSKTDEEIPLGAYITYNGIRYVLIDQYAPSKENAFSFKYDVLFRHPQNMLDRIPFWVKSKDSSGGDLVLRTSSFTGFPHTIAQKLVDFFAEYANETGDTFFAETIGLELEDDSEVWDAETNPWVTTWGINIPTTNDSAIITVGFDKSSLKSLANSIADAMGCNVFWNWNTKTIEFIAGTTITGEAYNCFHVLGGTTNMGKVTASGGYAAITQRLALADPVEGQDVFWVTDRYGRQRKYRILKGSIISGAAEGEMMLTKDLIFDDIYPKMELFIKTSRQRLCYLTDENGDFIVDQMFYYYMNGETKVYTELAYKTDGKDYDSEGRELTEEPTFKMFAKWYVSLAYDRELTRDYMFDQSKLIDDQPLSMLFQIDMENADDMSKLVGRQFELTYFPDDKKEWDKTDTVSYDNAFEAHKGEFRIAFVAEGEVLLPSVGTWTVDAETHEGYWAGLCPNVGDKVTLVNMALTDEVSFAKEDLLNAAKEIIGLMNAPAGEYTEQMVFNNPSERVSIGDPSPFNTPGRIQHGPVVTAITHNLDTDVADVTAGAWSRKTKTGGTADKLEVVTVSASASTIGGDKYGDGVIGEGYYTGTKQKEIETIQQTQLKPDGAYSAILSSTQSVLNCDEDGKVVAGASGVNLYTKIGAYYGTRDVTDTSSVTLNNVLIGGVTVWLQTSNTGADTSKQLRPNATEALGDEDRYWLRINVPNGYDLNEPLSISFSINQIAYDSRVLTYEISGVRASGGGSADGRFQSRVFARTNTDLSRAVVTGGSYSSPYPTETRINNQVVAVTWEDGIPQGKAILWSTIRWFYPDLTTDSWRTPAAETDTQTQDIEFAFEQSGGAQPAEPDDTNRHGGSGTQIWFDPVLDAEGASGSGLPSGHHWDEMVWRAEQKIENGEAVGEWAITRIKGEKGDSITKTGETLYYIKNTTGVRPAENDPNWSTTKPTLSKGEWLFTKIVISWSDGSTTVLYTDERNPNDGVSGQDIVVDGSTEMKYYVGDSNTTHPAEDSSDWKDLSQVTQTQGKWLWSKATTWYRKSSSAAGSKDAGHSCNYTVGYIAKDGAAAAAGRGITSVTEYYKATSSSAPMPTPSSDTGWSKDPNLSDLTDKWDQNHRYLWNYEKVTYDQAPTTERTVPQILAIWTKDGANGADGKGIDSITNYYKVTDTASTPSKPSTPGTEGWDDEPMAPNASNRFLWNYEVISWTDGSTPDETDVQLIGHFGKDGVNTVRLALDNEYEEFIYSDSQTLPIVPSGGSKSPIHFFDGQTEKTVTPTIVTNDATKTYGVPTSGTNAPSIITENNIKKLKVPHLTANSAKVTVKVTYNGQDYFAEFIANKSTYDRYELNLKPSSLAYNSATYQEQTIRASVVRYDKQGNKTTPTVSTSSTITAGNYYIFYGFVDDSGDIGTMYNLQGTSRLITAQECWACTGIYFELRYYNNASDLTKYRLCDYETVEIAKAENGADGQNGHNGSDGLQGCVVRVSEWKSGVEYRNDEGETLSAGQIGYIDVVGVVDTDPTNTVGYDFYRCKQPHTSSNSNTPPNNTYWEYQQDVGPIYTSLLIAKYAHITFGTGNQFVITNNLGEIKAGMKGTSDTVGGNGIRIWAGSSAYSATDANIANAPFRVYNDGSVVMTNADVRGTFEAINDLIKMGATLNPNEQTYQTSRLLMKNLGEGDNSPSILLESGVRSITCKNNNNGKSIGINGTNICFFVNEGSTTYDGYTGSVTISGKTLTFKGGILVSVS